MTQCSSQTGRPDDGTDTTGFFNTEYFVDLKPKEQWRPAFHQNKEELIAAMNRELEKLPGVVWGFSQPIADNMEEAVSGVKGQLATKVYGDDLHVLEEKAEEIVGIMREVRGIEDLGVFRVIGQPNDNFIVDRQQAARYQINVADVQDAINTAAGGNALTQVLQGEARYDLVMRYRDPKTSRYATILEAPEFNIFYDAGTLIVIGADHAGTYTDADCWLAAQNLMLAARAMGLGTCPIGFAVGVLNTPEVKRELGLAPEGRAVAPIIVGVPAADPPAVPRSAPRVVCWL